MATGLRLRFFLVFVGLAVGPILFVGLFLGQSGYSAVNQQSQRYLDVRAQQVRDSVKGFFERITGELTSVGVIVGSGSIERAQRAAALQSLILRNNSYQDIYVLDHQGTVLEWYSRTAVTAIVDADSFRETAIFKVPAATLRPHLADIRIDPTVREPLVSLAIPFADPHTSGLHHILMVNIRFKPIWDLLAGMEHEEGIDAYVVDFAGRIVAHRNPTVAMQGKRLDVGEAADDGLPPAREVLSSMQRAFIHDTTLTVVVEQELAVANRFANRFVWTTLGVSIVALAIAVFIFLLYERGVIAPLGRLLTRVDRLRKGDYLNTLDVGGYGEVGILADSFEKMVVELKSARERVKKSMDSLERRVEERTVELRAVQDTLLRQERLAALGELTGTVAHEIRNPLGTIANSIHVIKHRCSESGLDLQATLDRTDRSIKRCDRIITELLDFARARGIQPESRALDIWLSNVIEEQHIPAEISMKTNLQTEGVAVRFDPEELRRAVINVIDNACQAMMYGKGGKGAKAGGELTVASRLNGARVEVEIMDTGPGIPEDILPRVLEPLFSTRQFGTGLGLSTVQRIMEEHGGGLEINSEEGRGTQVILWLPLYGENEEDRKR